MNIEIGINYVYWWVEYDAELELWFVEGEYDPDWSYPKGSFATEQAAREAALVSFGGD